MMFHLVVNMSPEDRIRNGCHMHMLNIEMIQYKPKWCLEAVRLKFAH